MRGVECSRRAKSRVEDFQSILNFFLKFSKKYFENSQKNFKTFDWKFLSHYSSLLIPFSIFLTLWSLLLKLLILYSWTFYSSQNPLSWSLTLEQLQLVYFKVQIWRQQISSFVRFSSVNISLYFKLFQRHLFLLYPATLLLAFDWLSHILKISFVL